MAIAERMLAAKFNTPARTVIDHYTYVLASDGDMMEGVASEACSLAGHLGLGKLIVFYDSNKITIEGSTDLAFSENVLKRFEGYGWQTLSGDMYDMPGIMTTGRAGEDGRRPADDHPPEIGDRQGRAHAGGHGQGARGGAGARGGRGGEEGHRRPGRLPVLRVPRSAGVLQGEAAVVEGALRRSGRRRLPNGRRRIPSSPRSGTRSSADVG